MVNDVHQYLFVYGTLRKNHQHPMFSVLSQYAVYYSDAWFNGKLYMVTDYPCAIPSDSPEDRVFGELYQLKYPKLLLAKLDAYEECNEQFPEPKTYVREKRLVHTTNANAVAAWIYLYNLSVINLERIQSGDFVAYLADSTS
jgi:gamma-glutamylcyclotransferase (GGCT)/AIG2-like uncharacterized protein YtfP